MLQCVTVCCSVLQCVAVCCSALPCIAVRGCVAVRCVRKFVTVCRSVLQYFAVCCSALQFVAVCCSLLQCDAECCSVLQCEHAAYIVRAYLQRQKKRHHMSFRHCNTPQHTATHFTTHIKRILWVVATLHVPRHRHHIATTATHRNTLQQHTATHTTLGAFRGLDELSVSQWKTPIFMGLFCKRDLFSWGSFVKKVPSRVGQVSLFSKRDLTFMRQKASMNYHALFFEKVLGPGKISWSLVGTEPYLWTERYLRGCLIGALIHKKTSWGDSRPRPWVCVNMSQCMCYTPTECYVSRWHSDTQTATKCKCQVSTCQQTKLLHFSLADTCTWKNMWTNIYLYIYI